MKFREEASSSSSLRLVFVALAVLAAGCDVVRPSNPFDPDTSPLEQAPGTIIGTVVFDDDVDADIRAGQLELIRVGLVDESGRALQVELLPVENKLTDIDGVAGTGRFAFEGLLPGVYAPTFAGEPITHDAATVAPVRVAPGAVVDVGDVVFTDQSGEGGPGSISGTVAFDGGGDGTRTISLFTRTDATGVRLKTSAVSADGSFEFTQLDFGSYAIVAEGAARTPAYRLDIEVEGETLAHTFAGDAQIVLHPVTAVALPLPSESVLLDDGVFYVRDTALTIAVLSATAAVDVGVTGMRIGLNDTFVDDVGAPLPFGPYAASALVPLPATEGRTALFVQLEARSPGGFTFTSPAFSTSVVRDVTAPTVEQARVGGVGVDVDGVFLSPSRNVVVEFDGADQNSGVDRVATALGDAEPAELVFDDVTVAPGLARFSRSVGAVADGPTSVFVRLRDKAGNESPTTRLELICDESPPDVALVVDNAAGGTLASRLAHVSFTPNGSVDEPVSMQLRVQGGVFSAEQPFGAGDVVIDPAFGNHTDTVAIEARLFDRVGNSLDLSRDVTLDLTGTITGTVDADGVPLLTPSPAGAVVRVLAPTPDGSGAEIGRDDVDDDGVFAIGGVPEGSGYRVEVALDGYRTTTLSAVAVAAPGDLPSITDLGAVFVGLARGGLRVDVDDDGLPAAGYSVTIVLDSPAGSPRRFADAATTNAAGSAVFSDVPVTRAGESIRIEAVRTDDGASATSQAVVVANEETTALVSFAARADFDICAASGACTPTTFVNDTDLRVALRGGDASIDELLVSIGGAPAESLALAVDNATAIDLGAALDGRVDITIQPRSAGVPVGGVLRGSVILDRTAPTSVTIARLSAAAAIDARFTNRSLVDVVVDADFSSADTPDTAPPDAPRLVVADTAPATPPAELVGCSHGDPCAVTLPAREGVLRLQAVACDRAGNCAPAVSTFVIRDVTAPRAQNGVAFRAFAEGSVVDAGVTLLRDSSYRGELTLGAAKDAAAVAVVDDLGSPVADAFAFRASLDAASLGLADVRRFTQPPAPNAVRAGSDVVMPALEDLDVQQTVFVDVIDAAGNSSAVPLSALVRIDDTAPGLIVNVATQSALQSVPFTTTTPAGAEAARSIDVRVDGGDVVSFAIPLPGDASVALPNADGLHDVLFSGRDLVGNAVDVTRRITLDRVGPRVDLVRCVSAGCGNDVGAATFLTSDSVLTLQVNAVDALTAVASIAVTVTPLEGTPPLTPVTTTFAAGAAISGVALVPNVSSTLDVIAVDVVGNASAVFSRTVTQDATAPAITDLVLAGGAASTRATTVPVHIEVAAGDAVALRLSSSTTFSGPSSSFRTDETFVLAGADGPKTICVEVADTAGNRSNRCASILLDRSSPTGSIDLVGASPRNVASADVDLIYPPDTARVAVSKNALACDPVTTPFVTATGSPQRLTVALDAGDGVRTIFACFEDEAGGTAQATTSLILDQSRPVISVDVNAGAEFALAAAVDVRVTAPADVVDFALAIDVSLDCALATYVPFTESSTVTLPATDGLHNVVACARDAAGNTSSLAAEDDIQLDLLAPAGTIVVEGGAAFTRSEQVTVVLTRSADVVAMALAPDALTCAGADFAAFQGTSLVRLGGVDGLRSVVACLKDAAGRVSTGLISDTIELDRRAPVGTITIAGGSATTPVSTVNTQLTFDADTVGLFVSATPVACDTVPFEAPVAAVEVTLPFIGNNIVIACLKDGAGNVSSASDEIFVEAVVGNQLVIAIEGGAATTRSRSVNINVVRPGTNFDLLKIAEGANLDCAEPTGYEAFSSPRPLTFSAGTAPFEGTRNVAACVRDSLNATTTPLFATDSIFVDTFAPAGSAVINGAAVVSGSANVTLTLANDFAPLNEVVTVALSEASTLSGGQCSGSFEAFASGKGFTFSGLDGNRTVFVCLRDSAGNTSEVSDVIGLDRAAPAPVTVSAAATVLTTALTTTLAFPADAVEAALAEGSLDCATTTAYTPLTPSPNTRNLALSAVEGSHVVIACFRDAAANVSQATTVTNLDLSDPVGVVTLASAAGFTTTRDVTVTLSASADVVRMAKIESSTTPDCSLATYESFTTLSLFTLSAGDGVKTVQVCLEDRAGRRAAAVADTIALDQSAPNGTVVVDDGAAATRSRNVILTLGIGTNLDVVAFAAAEDTITCNAANLAYSPFSPQSAFLLSSGDGTKQLRTCLKDTAGNVSTSAGADSIILDGAPPVLAANPVSIVDGDGFVQGEATINVTLAWTTAGDAAFAKLGEGVVDCAGDAGYVALPANATTTTINAIPLSAAEGQKVVGVCFKDAAGNTVAAQDTSVRDNTAPIVTNLACTDCSVDGDTLFSRDSTIALALSVDEGGSGVASALVAIDGSEAAGVVVNGTVTVSGLAAGPRSVRVRLIDRAGNSSSIAQSQTISVVVDNAAPVLALAADFRLNGANSGNATNNATVAVSFNNPPVDVTAFALAESAIDCAAAGFFPFATNTTFTLSAAQGAKTVKLCLRDRAGNVSASAEPKHAATITLDSLAPSLPGNAVGIEDGGDELLSSVAGGVGVRLSWNTVGDVVAFKLGESSVDCGTEPYERPADIATVNTVTRAAFPLSTVDGTKVVIACFKDAAGNVITGQDTTVLDQAGPNGSLVVDGAATFSTDEIVSVRLRMVADVRRFALAETTATNSACVTPSLSCAAATYIDVSGAALIDGVQQLDVNKDINGAAAGVDGPTCFEVCFEDAAGNRTATAAFDGIALDQSAPAVGAGSITLTGLAKAGASSTLTRTPFISLAVAGAPADTTLMRVNEDSSFAGGTQAFAPFSSSTQPFTLSAVDGAKSVFVQLKDAAGNVGAATVKGITLDATAPIGVALVLNNGAVLANNTLAQAALQATGATEVRLLTPDNGADAEAFVAFTSSPATVAVTLEDNAGQDGLKTVLAIFRDDAGNEAPAANDAIELDRVAPTAVSLACGAGTSTGVCVNDGAVATNSVAASLTLAATGASEVQIATDGCADTEAFVQLTPLATALLPAVDGTKTVAVRFRDAAGNVDQAFVNCATTPGRIDTVVLDTVAPSAPLTVSVASAQAGDGAGFTTTAIVNVSFAFSPGAGEETQLKHGEGSVDCGTAAGYAALPGVSPLVVPNIPLSNTEGTKIYAACFKDAAGNVTSTTGQIVVDRTRPSGTIIVGAGQAFAASTSVNITVATSDDVAAVAFVNDAAPICDASLSYVAKAAVLPHVLSTGDGQKTVFACFKDSAGNFSGAPTSDVIGLDTTPPTVTLDLLEGSDSGDTRFVNTTQLTLLINDTGAVDADLLGVAFSQGALNCADEGIYLPFSSLTSFTITAGEGDKTINGCIVDESGNDTTLSKIVRLDTTAPTGAVVVTSTASGGIAAPLAGFTPTRLVNVQFTSTETDLRAKVPADSCDGTFNIASFDGDETRTVTLTGPEGTRGGGACVGDPAGNSAFFQGAINLDLTLPEGTKVSCATCGSDSTGLFTSGFDVDGDGDDDSALLLEVEAIDPNANGFVESVVARVDFNGDGDFLDDIGGVLETQIEPYDAFVIVRFPAAEATRAARISFVDAAGNESAEFDFDPTTSAVDRLVVTFDVTDPVVTAFALSGRLGDGTPSATLTTTRNTDLTLVASSDVVGVRVTESATFDGLAFQPLQSALAAGFFLSAADASKGVQLQVIDRAGNTSTPATTTITLDTAPPVLTSFLLTDVDSGSADITNSATVDARVDAAGATEMRLITEANPNPALIAFSGSSSVLLTNVGLDGEKTVTVVVVDAARNAAAASARITLDREAPVALVFNCPATGALHTGICIADAATATDVVTPTARIEATGATLMQVATDGCADTEAFEPFSSFITLVLPGGDGVKTVAVRFRDEAGNDDQPLVTCATTPGRIDTIVLDTVAPNGATVSIDNGAAFTTTENVIVTVAYPVDVVRFAVAADTIDCANASYTNVDAPSPDTTTATLSSGTGSKGIFACFKDAAGNISGDVDFIALTGSPRIRVAGDARATAQSSNVPVEILLDPAISEIVEMKLVDNTQAGIACDGGTIGFTGFNANDRVSFDDPTRNETKRVAACLKDAAGNVTGPFEDDIDLDTQVTGDLTLQLTGSAGSANTRVVAIDAQILAGTLDVDVVRIELSELASFADAVSFAAPALGVSYPFNLSAGDGTKTVRVRLVDELGNSSTPNVAQIRLDTTPPTDPKFGNGGVLLASGDSVVINALVTESTDVGSGLADPTYLITGVAPGRCEQLTGDPSQDGECRWDGRTPFTVSEASLELLEGETRMRVRALDNAGNASGDDVVTITLDTTPPTQPIMDALIPGDARLFASWTPGGSANDQDIAGFRIHYMVSPGGLQDCPSDLNEYNGDLASQGASPVDVGLDTDIELTDLVNGVAFCVAVMAYDDADNESNFNGQAKATTPYELPPTTTGRLSRGQLGTNGQVGGLAARNGFLYVAAQLSPFIELDVSNESCFTATPGAFPTCAQRVPSSSTLTDPRDVVVHGSFAFVADAAIGLRVFRINEGVSLIEEPFSPIASLGGRSFEGAQAVAVDENLLALVHVSPNDPGARGVSLVDIAPLFQATPASPTRLSTINHSDNPNPNPSVLEATLADEGGGVDLQGARLAFGGNGSRILWNVSDPSAPTQVDVGVCGGGTARAVRLAGPVFYFVPVSDELVACSTASAGNFALLSTASTVRARLEVVGPYLITAGNGRMEVLDASDTSSLRFLGRHEGEALGTIDRGVLAVDKTRVYYGGDQGGDLVIADLSRLRAIERFADVPQLPGATTSLIVDDVLINGDKVAHLKQGGVSTSNTVDLNAQLILEENGTIVTASGGSVHKTRRLGTLDPVTPLALETPLTMVMPAAATSLVVRWPYAAIHLEDFSTGQVSVRSVNLATGALINQVDVVLQPDPISTLGAMGPTPTSIGFMHGALYVAVGRFFDPSGLGDSELGLYRLPWNTLTGVVGAATQVESKADVGFGGVFAHGHRLYFWNGDSVLKANQFLGGTTAWDPATQVTLGLSQISMTTPMPTAVGNTLYIVRSRQSVGVAKLSFNAQSAVTLAKQKMQFPGSVINSVDVAGDRLFVTQNGRPLVIGRLR
ncbi:MAG: hypothetical protein Q8O67_23985 [Deltaproteobacteria bacterium]|nr:hypothetical protein [Deltaproteobacteria bacterium]